MLLIIIALVLVIPTYGLSLVAYVAYISIKSYRKSGNKKNAGYESRNSIRSGGLLLNKDDYYSNKLVLLDRLLKENDDFYGSFMEPERISMEADTNHPVANVVLGLIYHVGIHTPADHEKAESYYLKSIVLGCPLAYKYLSALENEKGNGPAARSYIQKGIEYGDSDAMLMLGAYYAHEIELEGGEKDLNEARRLFEMAAKLGNERAKHNLNIINNNT